MPSSIRKALNELPVTLDDTYERILQGIPKEKFEHASRLFQCMVAALRPLRVEELAEIFAIEIGPNAAPNLVEDWRPENPAEAVLSTCSTLITIIDFDDNDDSDLGHDLDKGSKIVKFSHFSVKEFLTSDRLQTSNVGDIRPYYTALEPAHLILAQACMTVLLQLVEKEDEERFRALPLASYATGNWVMHAKFQDVASRIQDSLAYLFNPKSRHCVPSVLLRGVLKAYSGTIRNFHSELEPMTPLYLAAYSGFSGLVKHLIIMHAPDVNEKLNDGYAPLHGASWNGHVDSACILLHHGADMNAGGYNDYTPLHLASQYGRIEFTRLLLERKAIVNAQTKFRVTPLYLALREGHLEVVRLLLDHGADVTIQGDGDLTLYQVASRLEYHEVAQLLLERGADGE